MVLAALVLFGAVCAAGLVGFVYYKETHLPPVGEFDTIIVLGAQVKADGTPSVALERRLTAALEEYRKQPRLMIVCGAQGSDEPRAEGDVMRDWLIAHGVAAADIEAETDSFNTRQNLGYAQSIMDDRRLTAALIVTSDYHVPRALALCTTGLENYTVPLGLGKWITSVTMTVFYVLLYYVWRQRYQIKGKSGLTASIYLLSAVRVVLCMMPQNQWLSATSPLSWGIYRNIPFALLGLLIIVLFYRSAKEHNDAAFRWMWLTIVLSFGFYIPVVLWADAVPMIGMLMIPKTCAYVWTVLIGFFAMKKECR